MTPNHLLPNNLHIFLPRYWDKPDVLKCLVVTRRSIMLKNYCLANNEMSEFNKNNVFNSKKNQIR